MNRPTDRDPRRPPHTPWRIRWAARLEWLIAAGTHGFDGGTRRRLRVLNLVSYLIALVTFAYALQYLLLDANRYGPVILINLMLMVVALLVPFAHRLHETAGGLLLTGVEYVSLYALTLYLGRDAGLHLQYFIGAAAPFVILGLKRLWLVILVVGLGIALHLAAWHHNPVALIATDPATLSHLYINAALSTGLLIAATVYYAYFQADKAQREVDRLLLNILPASIVERLKATPEQPIADRIEDASVMFLDLVGFTPLAAHLGPAGTVEFLGRLFNGLDELTRRHGVEKIKTMGDAYMAAAGLPDSDPQHLPRIARLALAARQQIASAGRTTPLPLDCRIGIAAGCVMAGVIGSRKFSYDIWGRTVNLASRMESQGANGHIMVPDDVKRRLENEFSFEAAGVICVKGDKEIECWFLTGAK